MHLNHKIMCRIPCITVCLLFSLCSNIVFSTPTLHDLVDAARAAEQVFCDGKTGMVPGFETIAFFEEGDFKAGIFDRIAKATRNPIQRIIAFRGSIGNRGHQLINENWQFNLQVISAASFNTESIAEEDLSVCNAAGNAYVRDNQYTNYAYRLSRMSEFIAQHLCKEGYGREMTLVTGHSLGGFLAQYYAVEHGLSGIGFDAPAVGSFVGICEDFVRKREAYRNTPTLYFESIALYADKVSMMVRGDFLKGPLRRIANGRAYSQWNLGAGHQMDHLRDALEKDLALENKTCVSHEYINSTIAFRAHNNYYLSSNQPIYSSSLGKAAQYLNAWEKFIVESNTQNDTIVYLRDAHGKYLSVHPKGQVSQSSNRKAWEQFKIFRNQPDHRCEVCSVAHGLRLQVDHRRSIRAVKNDGDWELFALIRC